MPHPDPTHSRMSGIWGSPVAHRTPYLLVGTGFLKPSHLAKAHRSQKGPGWEKLSPGTEVHSRGGLRLPTMQLAPKSPRGQTTFALSQGTVASRPRPAGPACSPIRDCTPLADFRATGKQHCLALRLPTPEALVSPSAHCGSRGCLHGRRVRSLSKHAVLPSPVITSVLPPRRPRHRSPQLPAGHQPSHSG